MNIKQFENNKGLWQSVDDDQIDVAKFNVATDLQLCCVNDFYHGRQITAITFEDSLPAEIKKELGTKQAVLFHLS